MSHTGAGYIAAAAAGLLMGYADIRTTFGSGHYEAFYSWCAWALVLLHAPIAAGFYALVQSPVSAGISAAMGKADTTTTNPILLGVLVGGSFSMLIRTKFLVGRNLGTTTGADGTGLDFGYVYDLITQYLKEPIDRKVIDIRQPAITELARLAPSVDWLRKELEGRVRLSHLLKQTQKEDIGKRIEAMVGNASFTEEQKRESLASELCDQAGVRHVWKLLKRLPKP